MVASRPRVVKTIGAYQKGRTALRKTSLNCLRVPVPDPRRILVIKHSALGDFILAVGAFKAIRTHHPDAHITLLTTAPYADLGRTCGWFDAVEIDPKPSLLRWRAWLHLRRFVTQSGFERVYDLQHSDRTHTYFRFFGRYKPEWSGIAKGCSHPHRNPDRNALHTLERQAEQLRDAGIAETPAPDLDWLDGDVTEFDLPTRFALLVPGGAPHRPDKRWPAAHYGAVATTLVSRGLVPVLIGTSAERAEIAAIAEAAPQSRNLLGQTSFGQIVALARRADVAIGNDTGPMHLIAAANCPAVVLFSQASVPAQTQPRGAAVIVIQRDALETLDPAAVVVAVSEIARST
jgi:ADP-heptose:LPS heptosyltransferase